MRAGSPRSDKVARRRVSAVQLLENPTYAGSLPAGQVATTTKSIETVVENAQRANIAEARTEPLAITTRPCPPSIYLPIGYAATPETTGAASLRSLYRSVR